MKKVLVDSSGWIEHLQGSARAALFAAAFARGNQVIVPSICLYEVHRLIGSREGDAVADAAVSLMRKCHVVGLDETLAYDASVCSRTRGLAMADAIIYATATRHRAELWTQDAHFKDLPGVRFFPKP